MTEYEEQLAPLRTLSPQCFVQMEGAVLCVVMPDTVLATANGSERCLVVLCPRGQSGYATRLLLERQIATSKPLNWQSISLLGRNWVTWSWRDVAPSQPWLTIFAEHARCLR